MKIYSKKILFCLRLNNAFQNNINNFCILNSSKAKILKSNINEIANNSMRSLNFIESKSKYLFF